MKLTFNPRGVYWLGLSALSTRLFCEAAIDGASIYQHAAWIPLLAGCILCLPLALLMDALDARGPEIAPMARLQGAIPAIPLRIYCAVLCLLYLADAFINAQSLSASGEYTSLNKTYTFWPTFFALLTAVIACLYGGRALCGAAHMLSLTTLLMLAFVVIAQSRSFQLYWLTPLLGPGLPVLSKSIFSFAALASGIVPLWLCRHAGRPDAEQPPAHAMLRLLGSIALLSAVLCILFFMLSPTLPSGPSDRFFANDRLLANGRMAISLQFPLAIVWHFALLNQLAFSLILCAQLLCFALPRLRPSICVLLSGTAVLALLLIIHPYKQDVLGVLHTLHFMLVALPIIIFAAITLIKGRKKHA